MGIENIFVQDHVLPRVIRARRFFGASEEEICESMDDINIRRNDWSTYLVLPSFIGMILPISMPLSLRLWQGQGYWHAFIATWNDRHALAYFCALWSKISSAESKVVMWITLA